MKDTDGLVANLLGICSLQTNPGNNAVQIQESTEYPYQTSFVFTIRAQKPFALKIRKPDWVDTTTYSYTYQSEDGYLSIAVKAGGTVIQLTYNTAIQTHTFAGKETYFSYGPLVYAHPNEAEELVTKTFSITGFADLKYKPTNPTTYRYVTDSEATYLNPAITVKAKNNQTQATEPVRLVPVSKTIMRQATF